MSTPSNRSIDQNDPSPYAPKWARNPRHCAQERDAPPVGRRFYAFGAGPTSQPANDDAADDTAREQEDLIIGNVRVPRSLTPRDLDPTPVPDPRMLRKRLRSRPSRLRVAGRVLMATLLASTAACYWVGVIPSPGRAGTEAETEKVATVLPGVTVDAPARAETRAADWASKMQDRPPVALAGSASEAAATAPPSAPVAVAALAVAPADTAASVAARSTLPAIPPAPAIEKSPPPAPVVRQIAPDEIAMLLKRGEEFVENGDFASARPVLQRAAEAGNGRAALILAGTFDPAVLNKVQVRGLAPDIPKAKFWYERARDLGSAEAQKQLGRLAGSGN